jgi:cysteine desulfurase family protein (TIGR01976 family)
MTADLSSLAARFPALSRTGPDGRRFVWSDCPGGSQMPDTVIEAISASIRHGVSNTHGAFVSSAELDASIASARAAAADVVGAGSDEVVFGPNATTLLFSVSRSIATTLRPGDEIVVSRLDHDANIRPWVSAAEDAGATVRWIDIRTEDATLDLASFDEAIGDRTKLVAFTLASNAVGTITPAAELVRRAHSVGALVALDGVHFAQHRALDVSGLGADILVCSPYKFFGPHLGILAARRALLERWTPYKVSPAPDEPPESWETGTQSHEALAGLVATADYIAGVGTAWGPVSGPGRREAIVAGFTAFAEHEAALAERFLDGLGSLPKVELFGIADPSAERRTPTFALRVGSQHPRESAEELGRRGIFAWDGHNYAIELMPRLGLSQNGGILRIGFCHYHSLEEVDRVLEALSEMS